MFIVEVTSKSQHSVIGATILQFEFYQKKKNILQFELLRISWRIYTVIYSYYVLLTKKNFALKKNTLRSLSSFK